nr:unnamed protein product [Callosobruchus analis]
MSLTLEKFDCEGDPSSVGARWERWKRALFIYLEASGIDSIEKKKASLLHFGGLELQEIFYNLPENDIESIGNADAFEVAIRKLDAYFAPKQSKLYEWHLFRLLRQDPNEKFDKFLVTLRQQADKCQFRDKDDHIVDPITEKCSSNELRKRMLQTGDAITLNIIIAEANALEAVNRQMEEFGNKFEGNQSVNKIDSRSHKVWTTNRTGCRRCGNPKHTSQDAKCPAKERSCLKCGLSGRRVAGLSPVLQILSPKAVRTRKTNEVLRAYPYHVEVGTSNKSSPPAFLLFEDFDAVETGSLFPDCYTLQRFKIYMHRHLCSHSASTAP